MIIDCHYHFETKLLKTDTLLKKMYDCGVDKIALMVKMMAFLIMDLSKEELKNCFLKKEFKIKFWEKTF